LTELTILVPVLKRPHRVEPLLESARNTVPDAEILFIADPGDKPELAALDEAGANYITPGGSYPKKINVGVRETDAPLVFAGADDITFLPGWFEAAKAHLSDEIRVVGVTDDVTKRNRLGHHAPHFLIARDYALMPTIDGRRGPLCELYGHHFVDDEFIGTCQQRGVIHIATDAKVHHSHYFDGSGEMDWTYEKGLKTRQRDRRIHRRRRVLWT